MLMERDREILRYIELVQFCTIRQIEKVFFSKQQYGYSIARRRLAKMVEYGYLRLHKDEQSNQNIYIFNYNDRQPKLPSMHRLIVLDVLAELQSQGCKIISADIEKQFLKGDIRTDLFVKYRLRDIEHYVLFEVQLSSHTLNIGKYDKLLKANEIYEMMGVENRPDRQKFFPTIAVVSDKFSDFSEYENRYKIIQFDTKLNEFGALFQ